jgi:uncharacterized phage protein gp47/JayE
MTTNVPPLQFLPAGLSLPEESAVLTGVFADLQDAFGGQLNTSLETPQGQLATSVAAIVADANATIARVVSGVNPDTSDGFMQDAIGRIYFMSRIPGAPTTVDLTLTGGVGTVIPVGTQAQDTSGNTYLCTQGGSIGVSGNVSLPFANVLNGPIPAPAGTVTKVYTSVVGWESVTNALAGIPGRNVETRAEFEARRVASVAVNAHGSLQSVLATVLATPGVIDAYATENTTSSTVNTGATSYPLLPHSLYVAAVGGTDDAIAEAIWLKKDIGCDYNGNTTVTVEDQDGYDPPYPAYVVKFERPGPLPILFAVQIRDSALLPSDIVNMVKAAIYATFTGTDGRGRVKIGSELLASKFYPGIIAIGPTVSVLSVLIGTSTPTLTSVLVGIDEVPTLALSDITVTLVP